MALGFSRCLLHLSGGIVSASLVPMSCNSIHILYYVVHGNCVFPYFVGPYDYQPVKESKDED